MKKRITIHSKYVQPPARSGLFRGFGTCADSYIICERNHISECRTFLFPALWIYVFKNHLGFWYEPEYLPDRSFPSGCIVADEYYFFTNRIDCNNFLEHYGDLTRPMIREHINATAYK